MASPASPEISAKPSAGSEARQSFLRKSVFIVGSIFFVLAIIYVAATVRDNWSAIATFEWRAMNHSWLALAAVTYGSSLITTAMVWPAVIRKWDHRISICGALEIGLVAQIGKYLPGNIAHYIGRAALAKRLDVSFTQSGLSTIVEFGAALSAAMLVAFGATLLDGSIWADAPIISVLPAGLFWPLTILALALAVGGTVFIFRWTPEVRVLFSVNFWIAPICWLTASFLLAGFSFYALAVAFPDVSSLPIGSAIAIYAIAWAAGWVFAK